jgi:phage terminase large subunit
MVTLELPFRFQPRPYQCPVMEAFIEKGVKRGVCVWHRRAGKDKTFINIMAALMAQRVGAYFYYFPTAANGRKILWEGRDSQGMKFLDHFPPGFIKRSNNSEMSFEAVNGSMFRIIGTDNLDVVGTNPVGCVFSETSLQNPLAWEYVRPILAENGGWALFNGTPRGKNWFHDLVRMAEANPAWFCQILGNSDTGAISAEAIQEERMAGMSEEMIAQEFECSFTAAIQGAIYAALMEQAWKQKRIGVVPHDESIPVWTVWDLGAPLNTAVWSVQFVGREVRMLACDTGKDWGLGRRVAEMTARGYAYAGHILPHDAGARQKGGLTFAEEFERTNLEGKVHTLPVGNVRAGINRVRSMLPAMSFDEKACKYGIAALEAYHMEEDVKKSATFLKKFKDAPCHDWSSHACDAVRYLAEAVALGIIKSGAAAKREILYISPLEGTGDVWPGGSRKGKGIGLASDDDGEW